MLVVAALGCDELVGGRGSLGFVPAEAVPRHRHPAEFYVHVRAARKRAHVLGPDLEDFVALAREGPDPERRAQVIDHDGGVLDVAVKLHGEGFRNLTMVVGSDRVREFNTLLKKYNGVESTHGLYDFKTIKVKSAGERDPDAEGVSGMSASKMRKAAMDNDFKSFSQGLPLNFRDGERLFNDIKKKMPIKEFKEWDDDLEEASVMAVLGKKLFSKEYVSAVKMYSQFIKRGDKPAMAVHKAATTHRHVNERELRKVIDAMPDS